MTLVCGGHPLVSALPHVALIVDDFLWACTLERASELSFVSLLDELVENGFDRECRELRLCRTVKRLC